jgi:hypothetical protein
VETIRLRVNSRRRRRRGFAAIAVLVLIGLALGLWIGWMQFAPNKKLVKPDYGDAYALFYEGVRLEQNAIMDGDELKLPLSALDEVFEDNLIRYEDGRADGYVE